MKLTDFWSLLKTTLTEWNEDKAPRLGAALAYYTVFSLAPLLIIVLAMIGFFYGEQAARGHLSQEIESMVGHPGAQAIEEMVKNTSQRSSGLVATLLGIATLILGASGLFGQLQDALNTIWKVTPKPGRGILGIVKDRFLSFTMVLGIGFILLVSLAITAGLSALQVYLTPASLPRGMFLWQLLNTALSFGSVLLLFALMFKVLPDAEIGWKDVWIGAAVTALLFVLGKTLIGLYLGHAGLTSAYGAAGSLVFILLWVYYSSQILLFGAEFTRVYANRFGSHVVPSPNAIAVTAATRAREGMPRSAEVKNAAQKGADGIRVGHGVAE